MILYHFTDFCYLQNHGTILREGLKAGDRKDGVHWLMAPPNAVWLTTDTEDLWRECANECRITVAIPSSNRRLVRWGTWLRKQYPPVIADVMIAGAAKMGSNSHARNGTADAWRRFWLYLDPVPLNMIRAIEHADPQKRAEAGEERRLHPEHFR